MEVISNLTGAVGSYNPTVLYQMDGLNPSFCGKKVKSVTNCTKIVIGVAVLVSSHTVSVESNG